MNLDLNDVAVFVQVVQEGGFTAAGRSLDLPASAVSRRVSRLETQLGFRLLHRTTRRIGLTDSGRIFYERTSRLTREVEEAARAVERASEKPAGTIRVTAPPDDAGVVWGMLSGFMDAHPDVQMELIHTLTYLDIIEEGIDVALRGGAPPDTTELAAIRLIDSRMLLIASPEYLERRGVPKRVEDLEAHDCIGMDKWVPNAIPSLGGKRLTLHNRLRVNRQDTARRAAIQGLGIAPTIRTTCLSDLRAGRLVEVLPGLFPDPASFWALYPSGRTRSAAARALCDHLEVVSAGLQALENQADLESAGANGQTRTD